MSKQMIKKPLRILDFNLQNLHSVEFLNDESTGNVRGDEKNKKETFLPLMHRMNYSICTHKMKAYMYGGLDPERNQVISTMETFDAAILKFQPVKYRGDSLPKGR